MVSGAVTTFANAIVVAVGYPIYLHFLGYEQYGIWLALSTVLSFAQLGKLGLDIAVMKLVAEEYGRKNLDAVQRYTASAMTILTISGTVALVLVIILRGPIVAVFRLSEENSATALWLLPYIGCLSVYVLLVNVLSAVASGLGRMDVASWSQSLGHVAGLVCAMVLLWFGWGVKSLLVSSAFSWVLVHVVSLVYIYRITGRTLLCRGAVDRRVCGRLLRFGGGLFGGSLIQMLLHPFNKVVLSRYVGVSSLPTYEIGCRLSLLTISLLSRILRPLVPEISRLTAERTVISVERVRLIDRKAMRVALVSGAVCYPLLLLTAEPLLALWLRAASSRELLDVVRIMLFGSFLTVPGVPAYLTIMGLGRVRHILAANALQAIANFLMVLLLLAVTHRISIGVVAVVSELAAIGGAWYLVLQKSFLLRRYDCVEVPSAGQMLSNPETDALEPNV
jgi:O-antigen/teichoic acid export membrane protein